VTDLLIPRICLHTPAESFLIYIWYPLFDLNNQTFVNIAKITYISTSFYMISKFFGLWLEKAGAFLAAFVFIFFPSHDSTVYWFLGQYLMLSMAFYLYAYYLAHRGMLFPAFAMAAAASFVSYGSPAIAIGLFVIFALKKEVGKGMLLLVPNIIYAVYYIFVTRFMSGAINRIPYDLNSYSILKQFIFQIFTFIDATLGPSMWLKIYYSLLQLSPLSVVIGILAVIVLCKLYRPTKSKPDRAVIAGFTVLTISSFAMFAVTGYYPQIAFNLGNRVTIFGSLLLAYLAVSAPLPRMFRLIIFSVLIFSILGISDHWKAWSIHQQAVIENIARNKDLKNIKGDIYVSGNQYSKFGGLNHIEFLSEIQVSCIFEHLVTKQTFAKSLNKRFEYEDGYLIDTKYDEKYMVGDYIYVYDSENDKLLKVKAADINKYVDSLPVDTRHWIQVVGNRRINDIILRLMPRLKYAF
jgi:hypothetical protein